MRGWVGMQWIRSNVRHVARLALLAMLVQFALTFGHSHWYAQAAPLGPSLQRSGAEDASKAVVAIDRAAVQKQTPSAPDREQPGDDNCAICALAAMTGSIVSATPPLLLLPQAYELLYLTTDAGFVHLKSAGDAFQPRAPPAS